MDYVLVKDELREAEDEVEELQRLLHEARCRQSLISTGQGELCWRDWLAELVYRFIYGVADRRPALVAESTLKDIDQGYTHGPGRPDARREQSRDECWELQF
mgnify:CR=1 FL=1